MAYNPDDRKACTRCGAQTYVTDPPHLCADIVKRMRRQERQRDAVLNILAVEGGIRSDRLLVDVATDIVQALNRLGIND